MRRISSHLTFANVVSVIALLVALGGSAFAVSRINGKDIKNRSIAGKKLKKHTVTGQEVRRGCGAMTGQIRGWAHVDASSGFPNTFTTSGVVGYNCSGQSVEARKLAIGAYEVRFNGSPVTASVTTAEGGSDVASSTSPSPGLFGVGVYNPPAGLYKDDDFTIITP